MKSTFTLKLAFHYLLLAISLIVITPVQAERAQREMQIHKVKELGLEIWVENEPPWEAELTQSKSLPIYVVQTPVAYYPPAVMSYASIPSVATQTETFKALAIGAVRQIAKSYKLTIAEQRALMLKPMQYGMLNGYEANFAGVANGEAVDVKAFIGHTARHAPVAMQAYTLRGKMPHLSEPIRRAWTHVKYLNKQ